MRNLTYEIKKEECVGDSVAKHNYNFLILDTQICNLRSTFFDINNNYKKYFDLFVSNKNKYETAYQNFNSEVMLRYDKIYSTIDLISSYWNKHEFSIILNFNLSKQYSSTKNKVYPKPTTAEKFEEQRIKSLEYLDKHFPSSTFTKNTTANVIIYYHSITNDDIHSSLYSTWKNNISLFSPTQKTIDGTLSKYDMYVEGVNVFKFENTNLIWNLFALQPSLTEQKLNLKIDTIGKTII
jgi:hypothetical protein